MTTLARKIFIVIVTAALLLLLLLMCYCVLYQLLRLIVVAYGLVIHSFIQQQQSFCIGPATQHTQHHQ